MHLKPALRLIDLAKAAGVSRSTASNVFNKPELVKPQVRARVEAAAEAMGYAGPDPKARLLRSGKFNAVGVVPPAQLGVTEALRNPVYAVFLQGVAQACDAAGASLVLVPDLPTGGGIRTALVDGFIFGRVEHLELVGVAKLRRLPFVVVDYDPGPDINSVRVDARAGGYLAARHLLGLGHRRFAIMSFRRGPGDAQVHRPGPGRPPEMAGMPTDQDKLLGYADALAEAGIDIDSVPVVQARADDRLAAALLLDSAPEATAFLSMSVMQGIALVDEARRRGLSVPQDLSVVGYNDIAEAALSQPPLTTVDGRGLDKGRIAAEMVMTGGVPRHEVLRSRLIIRQSTGSAPAG